MSRNSAESNSEPQSHLCVIASWEMVFPNICSIMLFGHWLHLLCIDIQFVPFPLTRIGSCNSALMTQACPVTEVYLNMQTGKKDNNKASRMCSLCRNLTTVQDFPSLSIKLDSSFGFQRTISNKWTNLEKIQQADIGAKNVLVIHPSGWSSWICNLISCSSWVVLCNVNYVHRSIVCSDAFPSRLSVWCMQ